MALADFLLFVLLAAAAECTVLDPDAGLKYYIIGGVVLGIFFAIVFISLFVLCWCCRLRKPKEDMTEVKTAVSRDATQPKHTLITSMAPRRDFMKKEKEAPYHPKPRLLNRQESTV